MPASIEAWGVAPLPQALRSGTLSYLAGAQRPVGVEQYSGGCVDSVHALLHGFVDHRLDADIRFSVGIIVIGAPKVGCTQGPGVRGDDVLTREHFALAAPVLTIETNLPWPRS